MKSHDLLQQIREDWRRAAPGLDTDVMLLPITLGRAADLLSQGVGRTAADIGLNRATRDMLFTLYRSAPPEGLTAGELSSLLAVTPGSITPTADRLEDRGLIRRVHDRRDRRSWHIQLTPAGRELVEQHLPIHLENERRLLGGLTLAEQSTLEDLLKKLLGHLEGQE